jgi:hypothetical protein
MLGSNSHGQLGNQTIMPTGGSLTPVDVHAFSAIDEDAVVQAVEYFLSGMEPLFYDRHS